MNPDLRSISISQSSTLLTTYNSETNEIDIWTISYDLAIKSQLKTE